MAWSQKKERSKGVVRGTEDSDKRGTMDNKMRRTRDTGTGDRKKE